MRKLVLIVTVLFFMSCASVPKAEDVPYETGPEELIVLAQRASDKNNYRGAKAYYEIIIDRFGSDVNFLNIAEFEIAHIALKQRKYVEAKILLERVLARFEGPGSALLKPEYRKLAEIDMKKLESKISKEELERAKAKNAKKKDTTAVPPSTETKPAESVPNFSESLDSNNGED